MDNVQPTPSDGASIHDRLMAAMEPSTNDSQTDEESADAEQATLQADDESISDDLEVEANSEELEADAESDDESEEETGEQYQLSDIAELIGFDEEKLAVGENGELLIKTKIDGEEGTAKLQDLWASYQLKGHLDNQNQKAAEAIKAAEAAKLEAIQQTEAKLQQLEDLSQIAWNDLMTQYNQVDWQELRQDDPAEYSAKLADFQQRQAQIQQMYQSVQAERQGIQSQSMQQMEQALQEENAKLVDGKTIPGWNNPEVAQKEYQQVLNYGKSQGYTEDVLKSMQRHQDVVVLYKAMKYDEMQGKKPEVKNKVKKAPKIARPGQPKSKQEIRSKEIDAVRKRIKSGEPGAFAEYLKMTGQV